MIARPQDRTFVEQQKKPHIYDLGVALFRDIVVADERIRPRMRRELLADVRRERTGEVIDRGLLRSVLTMLVELGVNALRVYEEEFEEGFVAETVEFYRTESQEFISSNTCPEFLLKVCNCGRACERVSV